MAACPYIPDPWRRIKQNIIVAGEQEKLGGEV